ncbi:hypothetical protein [Nonomuraea sp. NPDC050786]|uniref:hypothetical protein n=1 Tax=Nonomuraea sp. NPDC050786 TaxID=3154840 RepID=UPI003411EF59
MADYDEQAEQLHAQAAEAFERGDRDGSLALSALAQTQALLAVYDAIYALVHKVEFPIAKHLQDIKERMPLR